MAGELNQLQVVGPEIVAPFRNAVRLIDGEECHADLCDRLAKSLILKSFRGDVEQAQRSASRLSHRLGILVGAQCRIEPGRGNTPARQAVDLIFHQGYERRDHERQAGQQEGRQLVTERLATPGGKDRRGGLSRKQGIDDLLLAWQESVEAEMRS